MSNEESFWYLVFTKVRSEFKAQENLKRQGYIVYLPITQKNYRRNGKNTTTIEAFFPRYLFIQLNQETDNWRPISSTIGVSHMVRFGGIPAVVPKNLVESLKLNEDQSGLQPISSKKLNPGDKIVVIDGLFAGQYGIYQQLKGSERVAVLLDIVGKNTQVTLSMHDLQMV
ncbi:MAG: transcriptional activator [uncultured bacterium]|nr:MAG: transcriptional activator [uncultured bacterium]